jgi:hypothetical protein
MVFDDGSGDFVSITLQGCKAGFAADGSAHLTFYTVGGGAIALNVILETLGELRHAIRAAEDFLGRPGHPG